MRRILNISSGGRRICGNPRVGVLANEVPTGFPLAALLANDIDSTLGRFYKVNILTLPSAGVLYVEENSAFSFTGASDGSYIGTQRIKKYDPGVGLVSTEDTTYSLTIGVVADATIPVMAGVITSSAVTGSSLTLTWVAATDNIGVVAYETSINNGNTWVNVGNVLSKTYTSLAASTAYLTKVRALDAANNPSIAIALTVTTLSAITLPTQTYSAKAGVIIIGGRTA